METPAVETFEHDISDEISHKEATISDIAAATGSIGNTAAQKERGTLLIVLSGVVLILACVIAVAWYITTHTTPAPSTASLAQAPIITQGKDLATLSPNLANSVGRFISHTAQDDLGVTLTLAEFPPIFAYMLTNEQIVAKDIQRNAFTTPTDELLTFNDITLSNQNMRFAESASSTFVYAFVGASHLIFATSTDAIITLRSAILR